MTGKICQFNRNQGPHFNETTNDKIEIQMVLFDNITLCFYMILKPFYKIS